MAETKTKSKTRTYVSIALIFFILSGIGLAAGLFVSSKYYPKTKCKSALKTIASIQCQNNLKKYTVVSFCSRNKSIKKLALKKLKKLNKKCYKSYKVLTKQSCQTYYKKAANSFCPLEKINNQPYNTNTNTNTNTNINQSPNEPTNQELNQNTNNPGLPTNEDDQNIDNEFKNIEDELENQPEVITELTNTLDNINLVSKPGWPKEKVHDSEKIGTVIAANLDNQGNKEILNQSIFDGYLTIRINCLNSNNTNFNQKWPLDFSTCNYCGPKINDIPIPHASVQVPRDPNPTIRRVYEPINWAQPLSIGLANEIITSTINNVILFQFKNNYFYSLNQNAENNPAWPKIYENSNSNIVISNFENNQNTNLVFGNLNYSYILNNQGNENLKTDKKSSFILVDNSDIHNPKIISLDFTTNPPFLQIYDKNNNNIASLPNGLSLAYLNNSTPRQDALTLADINNDGSKEIIIMGNNIQNDITANIVQNNGQSLAGFPLVINNTSTNFKISSANLNQDNHKELVLAYRNDNDNFVTLKTINSDATTLLTTHLPGLKFSEPLLANLNNDDNLEIILAIDNSLYIIDSLEETYYKLEVAGDDPNQTFYEPTVIITDIDNNNKIDFISNIGNKINVWEIDHPANDMPWPMPDQNNQRTRIAP